MTPALVIVCTVPMAPLFGGRLAGAGTKISGLGSWVEGLDALRKSGAAFIDSDGNEARYAVRVSEDPGLLQGIKLAIVLVKSWQTERAALQLAQCLAPDGLPVTLTTRLGNRFTHASKLAPHTLP